MCRPISLFITLKLTEKISRNEKTLILDSMFHRYNLSILTESEGTGTPDHRATSLLDLLLQNMASKEIEPLWPS